MCSLASRPRRAEALKESRKFQNLRKNNVDQVRIIQEKGLWVLAGFIVGFDSDDETIFARQLEFIDLTAIAWAMAGILMAPPTTALFDRMKREGRLIEDSQSIIQFGLAEFSYGSCRCRSCCAAFAPCSKAYTSRMPFLSARITRLKVWQPKADAEAAEPGHVLQLACAFFFHVAAGYPLRATAAATGNSFSGWFLRAGARRQRSGWASPCCSPHITSSSTPRW